MWKKVAIIGIVFTWAVALGSEDYCSICSDHTMCRFGEDTRGSACGRKSEGGVSRAEIEEILRVHNEYRSTVAKGNEPRGSPGPQPFAGDMYALVWDDKLAEVAQRWADQCTFQHDRCRDDPRFPVGQNIYLSSGSTSVSWSRAIQTWYDEVSQMNPRNVSSYGFNFNTGHYTQMTWAKTRYVGCGRRSYGGSYRPRSSRPIEYVLSEARGENVTEEEPGYFGIDSERIDLSIGARGAITSAKPASSLLLAESQNFTEDSVLRRIMRQEPGYFGGADLVPTGTQGALTKKPGVHGPAVYKPVPVGGVQTTSKPVFNYNRPKYQYPGNTYPGFMPYYPYGQYVSFKPEELQQVLEDSSESLENSSEDTDDNRASVNKDNQEVPKSLQLSSWTSQGWMTQSYDMARDQIFICNYGPAGNSFGEPVYESGEPCSKCPDDTTCSDGLCI